MRINSTYIVFDFETGSKNKNSTQPVQIAALAIDGKKLEIIGEYNSYIKASEDKKYLEKYNLDPVSDEALNVNKVTWDQIRSAPEPKVVWKDFCAFVNKFNYKKSKWTAPIAVGYNILNFDIPIVNRLCGSEPYKFGPFDDEYKTQSLFNPIYYVDLMHIIYFWFESLSQPKSLSFDSLRTYFGMASEKAHNAVYDTAQCAELFIRFAKLTRNIAKDVKFEGAFGNV